MISSVLDEESEALLLSRGREDEALPAMVLLLIRGGLLDAVLSDLCLLKGLFIPNLWM